MGPDSTISEGLKILYKQEGFRLIGDSEHDVSIEEITTALQGKLGWETRIDIDTHANNKDGNICLC